MWFTLSALYSPKHFLTFAGSHSPTSKDSTAEAKSLTAGEQRGTGRGCGMTWQSAPRFDQRHVMTTASLKGVIFSV
jgi:hypothetical protein